MDVSTADMERIRKEMAESSNSMDVSIADMERIRKEMAKSTVKSCSDTFNMILVESKRRNVRFCPECKDGNLCTKCDKTFESKRKLRSTTLHNMKDVNSYVTGNSSNMIVDLGAPNSVISRKDKETFIKNLSKHQRENLHVICVSVVQERAQTFLKGYSLLPKLWPSQILNWPNYAL